MEIEEVEESGATGVSGRTEEASGRIEDREEEEAEDGEEEEADNEEVEIIELRVSFVFFFVLTSALL